MLRAIHSNRVEELAAALIEALPPLDPFAPSTIVVGSRLVARWLVRELAFARGIASGVELVDFHTFVERVWAGDPAARAARIAALDRGRLGAAFASVLADEAFVRSVPAVAAYLAAAPAPGDRAGPRRVQLAEHLASLTWSYAMTRPDWMPALAEGHVPGELEAAADAATARWQARVIHAALARLPGGVRWAPAPMLPWLRRRAGLPPPRLASPVGVFGMSLLSRAQLEALTDLATTSEVTTYVLDPCEELWDDVAGRAAARTISDTDPLPLVLWGRPVRDTLAALVERTAGDVDGRFAQIGLAGESSAREHLLADVLARRAPSGTGAGAGVHVLACPNPRREVEVIATEVRRLLDADPTLSAHEIVVWVASNADYYLAQAPSAFEAVGVPCHLIDAPIDDRGRIGEAVLALLELPTSGMARRDLLRVMTHPAVLAAHPHVDAADWVWWTERLGIAHGADARAHASTYLADLPNGGHFHWDQGVRRLALGAFMIGERPGDGRGPARISGSLVAPEELRPDQQASAATYALLVRSLCADAAWLAVYEAPLARWAEVLAALVDQYLAPRDDEAARDLERTRSMLANLARLDVDGRTLGFREVREHVTRQLASLRAYRGEPLAAGVMIAPLVAMRAQVPMRIAFVAGLDEGSFPAGDHASPLDLRRALPGRHGDVSPRDRDRSAFLDVLLCARDSMYLSYVAVEPKSGQPLGPSSVVLELADALAPYLGDAAITTSREALAAITTHHPLHRHGGAAPGAERERWASEVRDALRTHLRAAGHPIPDEDGQLALLAHPSQAMLRVALGIEDAPASTRTAASRSLTIANLRGFVESPIQAWAQAVLGLDELPDDEAVEHSDEPFHLGRDKRALLLREVFAAQLRGGDAAERDVERLYDDAVRAAQLRGQFPVGVFAEAARSLDLGVLRTWNEGLGSLTGGLTQVAPLTNRSPRDESRPPRDESRPPRDESRPPRDESRPPRDESRPPRDESRPPRDESRPPRDESRPPRDESRPPRDESRPPRDESRPPRDESRPPRGTPSHDESRRSATRFGFGRASAPGAELRPALALDLPGGRQIRLVGQTELLVRDAAGKYMSIVTMLGELEKRSHYHLRGAFDHLLLAAAGIATGGHIHRLLDKNGKVCEVHHDPWSEPDARAYLAALAAELLDRAHGYLLPFDALVRALGGRPSLRSYGDPTHGLGYGPIQRRDGLELPADAVAIAQRRLRPLVERMRGDHGFEIVRSARAPAPPVPPRPLPPRPPAPDAPLPQPTRDGRPILQVIKGGRS